MHRGRHHGLSNWRSHACGSSTSTDDMLGPDALGICLRCATSVGVPHHSRQPPGPTGSGRRRLGLSRPSPGEPTSATATRTTTQHHPGHQLEGPGQALSTRPTTRLTRDTCQRGHRGHGAGAGGLHGGHGQRGAGHTLRPSERAASTLNGEGSQPASDETPPRCGVTLARVKRPCGILVPRARQAPDGGPSGGRQPTDSRRLNRRI